MIDASACARPRSKTVSRVSPSSKVERGSSRKPPHYVRLRSRRSDTARERGRLADTDEISPPTVGAAREPPAGASRRAPTRTSPCFVTVVQALAPFSSLLLIVCLTWDNSEPGRNSDFYVIPITVGHSNVVDSLVIRMSRIYFRVG